MNIEKSINKVFGNRILLHAGFWIIFFVFALFGETGTEKSMFTIPAALHLVVHFAGFVAAVYLNLYVLIPRFLVLRKFIFYFLLAFLTAFMSTLITQQVQLLISNFIIEQDAKEDLLFLFFHLSFYCFLLMMITTLFYFLRRRMSMQEMGLKLKEVEKQNMVTELKMLKSQINPHFFFNSLNSIYSLALENNPKTPEVVLQLSELMRYVLYDSSADRVDLKSEIEFLKNYVELEKSRFESSIRVEFSHNDNLPESVKIAPLLFIPFIENAFKHCNKGGANIPEIIIQVITSKLPAVELIVENSREPIISENKQTGGVGLENAKKRLELIYPDHHKLKVVEEENKFLINLEIDLS